MDYLKFFWLKNFDFFMLYIFHTPFEDPLVLLDMENNAANELETEEALTEIVAELILLFKYISHQSNQNTCATTESLIIVQSIPKTAVRISI